MDEAEVLLGKLQQLLAESAARESTVRAQVVAELETDRQAVEAERAALVRQRQAVADAARESELIIRLNVGGVVYSTSLDTLQKEPESFLAAMFSGRHQLTKDPATDAYFIDRDGVVFRHILNYLRRGRLLIPEDDAVLAREVLEEARYFQIRSLVDLLRPRKQRFVYASDGDTNGLFYHLGTAGGTRQWINPAVGGEVKIRASKTMSGPAEGIVGREAVAGGICTDSRSQHVEIDIGPDRLLLLTHYTLRKGQCCGLGNWLVQGSPDRQEWTTLSAHSDDFWPTATSIKTFQLPVGKGSEEPAKRFCRFFRFVGSGRDAESATCYCMHFSGVEFYGDLRSSKRKERKHINAP